MYVDIYLWIQVSEDIHSCFLHHCKQVRVVLGPFHVPDVLALQPELPPCLRLPRAVGGPRLQLHESQNP